MKQHRCWIEIVMLGTAIACAIALMIATLGAVAGAAVGVIGQQPSSPVAEQTREGVVTCSRCGARHSAYLGKTATDCAVVCVRGGATFALVNGDQTYLLSGDLMALKRAAGRRSVVVGSVTGNTIRVSSVKVAGS